MKIPSPNIFDGRTLTVHQTLTKLLSAYNNSVQVSGIESFYISSRVN